MMAAIPHKSAATRSLWRCDAPCGAVRALGLKATSCDGIRAEVNVKSGGRTLTEARARRTGFSNALRSSFESPSGVVIGVPVEVRGPSLNDLICLLKELLHVVLSRGDASLALSREARTCIFRRR